jgi:hypothetical protein
MAAGASQGTASRPASGTALPRRLAAELWSLPTGAREQPSRAWEVSPG